MGMLEDIEAIKQLKAEYCYAMDENRLNDLVNLFTEDAICDFEPYFGIARGRSEILRKFQEVEDDRLAGSPLAIHAVTNPLIRVEGDHATGKWYLLDCIIRQGEPRPLRIIARYDEQYRRVNREWKIQHEKIIFFHVDVDDVEIGGKQNSRQ
jgi:ketosteroid isomerase-like protein